MANIDINTTLLAIKFFEVIFLIILVTYVFYAFILTKRVNLMNRVFKTPKAKLFRYLAQIHLIIAVIITIITLMITLR